ncbi:unnamed protein product, partial [Prorocentrum cordatum]
VERARLAAVEALRRLQEEDLIGQARASGVKYIHWVTKFQVWRVKYKIKNGPDRGCMNQAQFRPKDESPEEVERARLDAVKALRRLQEEARAFGPIGSDRHSTERQSGVKHIHWDSRRTVWRISYRMQNGPHAGRRQQPAFRPKDESPEEVEQARLAAVEALRRLEEEDLLGQARVGSYDPAKRKSGERQSGVKYVDWVSKRQAWRVRYVIKNGPDKGTRKQPTFSPKDESPEEVERARLAAVEALRRLQEEDRALEPSGPGEPCAGRGLREVPLLDGLFLVVGDDAQRQL